jgi:hypothetical protein
MWKECVMGTLTKVNFEDKLNFSLKKACKLSKDKDGKEAKNFKMIHLEVDYEGMTFGDAMAGKLKSDVIAWQNTHRKEFDKLTDGQEIKIKGTSPGSTYIDPEAKFLENFENLDHDTQMKKIEELKALMKAKKAATKVV